MTRTLHPSAALYDAGPALPRLPPCVHYAGSERHLSKALALQRTLGPVFDVACDCEDGAPVGEERAHAKAMAALIAGADNAFNRVGARIHDLTHPAWRSDLDILVGGARRADRVPDAAQSACRRRCAALSARAARRSAARGRAADDTGLRHDRDPGGGA